MKNVLLIDSGSGGVNVLKECVKIVPFCNYLMFCDNVNMPYGNKSKIELQEITLHNLENIYKFFRFDIVVLACNTLTSTCIEECRKVYPDVEFIGTVPAVKPALLEFSVEDILVIGTKATIKHNILINRTKGLTLKALPNLASQIDENLDNVSVLKDSLKQSLKEYKPKAVVLGCTHYVAVKDLLKEVLGENVKVFDSANGVARRLKSFVEEGDQNYQVQFMTSQENDFLTKLLWYYKKQD